MRHRYVDRQHTAPQQMKQHRQHRDRIARSCCARHQRCRRHEHPPQHLADVWQVMAGMPVPGEPPQVRGHDRIRGRQPADSSTRPSRTLARWPRTWPRPAACAAPPGGSRLQPKYRPLGERRSPVHARSVCPPRRARTAKSVAMRCRPLSGRHPAPSRVRVSFHDSKPTCPPVVADHHSPLRCRCPLCEVNRRIGLHDSKPRALQ